MKKPQPKEEMTREEAREYVLNCLKTILKHDENPGTEEKYQK